MKKKFAAFIMTYERAGILPHTIEAIFNQTLPPEKVLIIDNSNSSDTETIIRNYDSRVAYHRMGYNSGPAGAAYMGLKMLADEGYRWIYWGDDDDPPPTVDTFKRLVELAEGYGGKCGQVGMVGHRFNRITSTFRITKNKQLYRSRFIRVDSIGGNQCKIVSGDAVREGILPEAKLFFGFEDLDFDLALKKEGYDIVVDSQLFLECRRLNNRLTYHRRINRKKKISAMWRDYYSIRNMLYITTKNRYYLAMISAMAISLARAVLSFRHGLSYGRRGWRYTVHAIRDFFHSRYGVAST